MFFYFFSTRSLGGVFTKSCFWYFIFGFTVNRGPFMLSTFFENTHDFSKTHLGNASKKCAFDVFWVSEWVHSLDKTQLLQSGFCVSAGWRALYCMIFKLLTIFFQKRLCFAHFRVFAKVVCILFFQNSLFLVDFEYFWHPTGLHEESHFEGSS